MLNEAKVGGIPAFHRWRPWLVLVWLVLLGAARAAAEPTVGLIVRTGEATPGYTLLAPMNSPHTYLIDQEGRLRHRWTSRFRPGAAAYLEPGGGLLRAANVESRHLRGGGAGGRIEAYDWDGNRVWAFDYVDANRRQHHDAIRLPNGNVLMIAWQRKTAAEAIAAGRDPDRIAAGEIWSESLIEVRPSGEVGGDIVWEWHAWDHLVQDRDPGKANFGVVASSPGRIDINYFSNPGADWLHFNGLDYHPGLDQVLVSVHALNEIWIIDHGTTTAEAATGSGGRRGRGGDLLYRWGNPAAYGAGDASDQTLFGQHNPQWIDDDLPGAGQILVFNNGNGRPEGPFSTIDEIVPPMTGAGDYVLGPHATYGPEAPVWIYRASPPGAFYAGFISGAQRLRTGHTLICSGPGGAVFEVTGNGREVWRYINPVGGGDPVEQGSTAVGNSLFRAVRYAMNDPGVAGLNLLPLGTIELPPDRTLRMLQPVCHGTSIAVRWTSLPGQMYWVECRSSLDGFGWTTIGSVQAVGTEAWIEDDPGGRGGDMFGFYRVVAGATNR